MSTPKRRSIHPDDRFAELREADRAWVGRDLADPGHERLADESRSRFARVADPEVDHVDAPMPRIGSPVVQPRERVLGELVEERRELHRLVLPEQELLQCRIGSLQLADLDLLVRSVGEAGRTGTEVHGIEPTCREVGDVRPRLLRLDVERAGAAEPFDERRVESDWCSRRVLEDLDVAPDELADALRSRLRAFGRARSES